MKLKVLGTYRCRGVEYPEGRVIEVSEEEARQLMADAPGCFEVVEGKALDEPPKDKQIKEPPRKKAGD